MIFNYNKNAGEKELIVDGDSFVHIFKSRRTETEEILEFRNMKDDFTYFYKVKELKKKKAILDLQEKKELEKTEIKRLHIGWCLIDPKTIKEALPYLNQIGVSEISFIVCERSQKNFSIKLDKLEKILISSSEQCGRNNLMKLNFINSLNEFLEKNDDVFLLDFGGQDVNSFSKEELGKIKTILIGAEGGMAENERAKFFKEQIISFENGQVLKSETAVIAIASKLIL